MARERDEEAAGSVHEFDGNIGRYHDDPDELSDEGTPLRTSERPSAELDDIFREAADGIVRRLNPTSFDATPGRLQGDRECATPPGRS